MSDQPEIRLSEFGDLSRRQRRELEARGIDPDTAVIEFLNTQSIPIQQPAAETVVEVVAEVAVEEVVVSVVESVTAVVAEPAVEQHNPLSEPYATSSTAPVPVVPLDVPTTTAEIFPAMSKRELRNVFDRAHVDEQVVVTPPAPVDPFSDLITDAVNSVDVIDEDVVVAPVFATVSLNAATDQDDEENVDVVEGRIDVVEDDEELSDELDNADDVDEVEEYSGPTTIAEVTAAAALEQAIAAHNAARLDNGIDEYEDFEQFSGPSTGSIPTISSALILPTLPEDTGTIIPVVATGEVIITEQVIIPSSIAQVGAEAGTLDTSEIDIIEDEAEITPNQDLAPVRAASAVSSYNANNAVVTVPKRMSDRLPLVLSITAAGLAVAVVALFVTGYFLGIF